jgi:hypothetical protein
MVQIDLNDPRGLTLEAVKALLAAGDPRVHNQLRVTRGGMAYLSTSAVGGADIGGLSFRLETWAAGSGCVGEQAAADDGWAGQVFRALQANWPVPASDYIDIY